MSPARDGSAAGQDRSTATAAVEHSAALVRAALRERSADVLPLAELVRSTGLTRLRVIAAVEHDADLGTCGEPSAPLVWTLPAPALTSGFAPRHRDGRLVMWLAGLGRGRSPLLVGGQRLGPGPTGSEYAGLGELGHRVRRIGVMARRWLLTPEPDPSEPDVIGRVFELVGRAWHGRHRLVWADGALHVHEWADERHVGRSLTGAGGLTDRLEIVTWRDRDGRTWLVNLYPAGTHRAIVDVGG